MIEISYCHCVTLRVSNPDSSQLLKLLSNVLAIYFLAALLNQGLDECNCDCIASLQTMLGNIDLQTRVTVASLALGALVPRLGLFVVEAVAEAVVQLLCEGTVAEELLSLLQHEEVRTNSVLLVIYGCSQLDIFPKEILSFLLKPFDLIITALLEIVLWVKEC